MLLTPWSLWHRIKRRLAPRPAYAAPVAITQAAWPNTWVDAERLEALLKDALQAGSYRRLAADLSAYQGVPIDEDRMHAYDTHFERASDGRRRIATTDARRQPADDEVVICYGSFPPSVQGLCFGSSMRRYVLDFWEHPLPVDQVEAASCWQAVDQILYINLDRRPDRKHALLRELARGGVPLDRVERLPGEVVQDVVPAGVRGAIGCLAAHLKACRRLRDQGIRHALILEDDFGFCDDVGRWQADLNAFFSRQYDYDICLLATSKYGPVEPLDDLVSLSHQAATNTSAYLVSAAGLERLIPCYEEALVRLRSSLDANAYAADRCWAALQGERFLMFNRKMGFQVASYSDIESTMASYLD